MADETGEHAHVLQNRAAWDGWAPAYAMRGHQQWAAEPSWGYWRTPETELGLLPDVTGRDAVELGCGTAYVAAWLARRGARVVGLDNSPAQLRTARALQCEFGVPFPLIHADAERTPLRGGTFDLVISDYGASIWCDPYRLVPEAARLLRPGGHLVFIVNGTLSVLCAPDEDDTPPAIACCATTSACTASPGRTARPTSTWATATGSVSCAAVASRSRTWSSYKHLWVPPPPTHGSPPTEVGAGPPTKFGSRAGPAERRRRTRGLMVANLPPPYPWHCQAN